MHHARTCDGISGMDLFYMHPVDLVMQFLATSDLAYIGSGCDFVTFKFTTLLTMWMSAAGPIAEAVVIAICQKWMGRFLTIFQRRVPKNVFGRSGGNCAISFEYCDLKVTRLFDQPLLFQNFRNSAKA